MIIRRRHTAHFTTIGNALFEDERLAADEVGILAYLLSRPHDWEVRRPALMRRWHMGTTALKRVVDNWMRTGWARAEKVRLPNGTFDIVYEIRDEPGPSLSEEEVRRALSLVSGEVAADEFSGNSDLGDVSATCDPPPPDPGVVQPVLADHYVADSKILNTDLPRKDSNQNPEREARARAGLAKFITAFEMRWPTATTDDRERTARAATALPEDERGAALNGIGPFLDQLKRDGRKNVPAGWRYLGQLPWKLATVEKPDAAPTYRRYAADSAEAKAIQTAYALAGKQHLPGFMRLGDGSVNYRNEVGSQLLALSAAPATGDWPNLTHQQAGAWNGFLREWVTLEMWTRLKEGDRAPWPWPPKKDGSLYTGPPPDVACSDSDLADFATMG